MADVLLDAEAKLGEMLAGIPLSEKRASSSKGTCSLPPGISKKSSHYGQEIASNPEVVKEVKEKAREILSDMSRGYLTS